MIFDLRPRGGGGSGGFGDAASDQAEAAKLDAARAAGLLTPEMEAANASIAVANEARDLATARVLLDNLLAARAAADNELFVTRDRAKCPSCVLDWPQMIRDIGRLSRDRLIVPVWNHSPPWPPGFNPFGSDSPSYLSVDKIPMTDARATPAAAPQPPIVESTLIPGAALPPPGTVVTTPMPGTGTAVETLIAPRAASAASAAAIERAVGVALSQESAEAFTAEAQAVESSVLPVVAVGAGAVLALAAGAPAVLVGGAALLALGLLGGGSSGPRNTQDG